MKVEKRLSFNEAIKHEPDNSDNWLAFINFEIKEN